MQYLLLLKENNSDKTGPIKLVLYHAPLIPFPSFTKPPQVLKLIHISLISGYKNNTSSYSRIYMVFNIIYRTLVCLIIFPCYYKLKLALVSSLLYCTCPKQWKLAPLTFLRGFGHSNLPEWGNSRFLSQLTVSSCSLIL